MEPVRYFTGTFASRGKFGVKEQPIYAEFAVPRLIALVCLLLAVTGCSLFTSKQTRAMRRTPEYRAGYNDGCSSARGPDANMRAPDDVVRDDDLYASNNAYHSGWSAGYGACRTYSAPQATASPDRGPVPDTNPGNGGIP
jgi:hypothetical protein